jgi:hypothetical protein
MYLWANTRSGLGPIKEVSKANKPTANIVPRKKETQASLEFHHVHVFAAAFMMLLFVENSIVGNAIWQK